MSSAEPDLFPSLKFAMVSCWNFFDHWAWRRMRRLSVPTPWMAYELGYKQALLDFQLEIKTIPPCQP